MELFGLWQRPTSDFFHTGSAKSEYGLGVEAGGFAFVELVLGGIEAVEGGVGLRGGGPGGLDVAVTLGGAGEELENVAAGDEDDAGFFAAGEKIQNQPVSAPHMGQTPMTTRSSWLE